MSDEDPWITVAVWLQPDTYDDYGLLTSFHAKFTEGEDAGAQVGVITGWIGWSVGDADLLGAADAISADSAYIGQIAASALEQVQETEIFVDDVLLIDRIYIESDHRGKNLLRPILDNLVQTFRLQIQGCVVVTEPEPQRPGGGPYPEGEQRDAAMAGLIRSLEGAGFSKWGNEKAMWMLVLDN